MPRLVKLYILHVAIGFAIAVGFVAMLLLANVANLRHLMFNTSGGYLALFLLVFFNGLVFAGVQFAIAVMRMADPESGAGGTPLRQRLKTFLGDGQPVETGASAPRPVRVEKWRARSDREGVNFPRA